VPASVPPALHSVLPAECCGGCDAALRPTVCSAGLQDHHRQLQSCLLELQLMVAAATPGAAQALTRQHHLHAQCSTSKAVQLMLQHLLHRMQALRHKMQWWQPLQWWQLLPTSSQQPHTLCSASVSPRADLHLQHWRWRAR
jgi:hypothetical protein